MKFPLLNTLFIFILIAISSNVKAQLSVNITNTGTNPVPTGQDVCFNVSYTWSSTTQDLNNAKIEIPIPIPLAGDAPWEVNIFNSSHVANSNYDPSTRKLTWNMINPLPAGSSGTVQFCVHFANGTTTNGSTVTLTPSFSGNGQIPASSNTNLTASASTKATLVKSLKTDPALDNEATYTIAVNNDQGNGNYNLTNVVISDQLPAGSIFISASSGGTESGGVVTWNIPSLPIGQVKYLKVKIKYPSGTFNIGDAVTNVVNMSGNTPAGSMPGISANKTNVIAAPNPLADIQKYSWTDWMSLKGNTGYGIYNYNNGNVPLTNVVMEDALPSEFNMVQLGLGIDGNGSTNHAVVEYQTKNNATWQIWPGSPFTLPANPASPDRTYLNVSDLGFDPYAAVPTDYVTRIRITMDEMAVNYEPSPGMYYSGFPINADKNGVSYSMPKVITNVLDYSYTGAGVTKTGSHTDIANVVGISPKPYVDKSIGSNYYQQPNNSIIYNFRIFNRWEASEDLKTPYLADLLPPDISIDPAVFSLSGPIGAPNVTIVNNFNNTGRQLVKFNWPSSNLPVGGDQYWSMNAKIKAGAAPGDRQNLLLFMGSNNSIINSCDNPQYVRDTFDIDGDGITILDTLPASSTATYNIVETTAIESYKYVKGECDTKFHKYPDVGKTIQGGTFQYKLYVYNIGNKALTNIKTMDILPWVGDVGVITHNATRESKYRPSFVSMDYIPSGVTVKYSTSSNPCRVDLDSSIPEPSGGCDAGTFSTTMPSNLTDIRSLIFDFGATVIQPGDSLELRWTMKVPYGVAPGDVSWNSFGHRSESVSGTLVPPAEPIKVGVTVKAASIGNYVWVDNNKNGLQDDGSTGVGGVLVHLLDQNMIPVIDPVTNLPVITTTDPSGYYLFNVNPGTYFVKFDAPSGYSFTKSKEGGDDSLDSDVGIDGKTLSSVTVADGEVNLNLDAGLKLCIQPIFSYIAAEGTCNGASANNDAKIDFNNILNSDRVDFIESSSYGTSPAYGDLTNVTITSGTASFAALKHNTAYTFRFWNADNSCFKDTTIITPSITCVLPCNLSATVTGTNVTCNGGSDGTASVTASGNIAPVTYLWSNGATTQSISNLTAGTYTVTVTETPTCSTTASYTVTEPVLMNVACTKSDVTTNGGTDGTANVSASGGTSPYTYLWSNGTTSSSISNLSAGTYSVTVSDSNGCTSTCSSIITQPSCNVVAVATGTNVLCNGGSDGSASVTASGNIAPVSYLWSNGATTQSISNLSAGTYSVTVTETPTCSTTASYTVTEPVLMNVVCAKSDVTTNGGTDGTANVSASGGTSPYTYLWSNGSTSSSISNLNSGTYSVTVSDSNGCTSICSSVVNEPGCNLSATTTGTNVTCNGGTNGSVSVTASGNIAPVTYLWSNGATTQSISNLSAGTYSVTVTETPTCSTTASYTVTEPVLLNVVCTKSDVTTNGGTDGTANVSASGGTSPYTYLWSNGATTSSISNLSSGTYSVTVSDSNGCTSICSSVVNAPGCNLSASTTGTNVTCNGGTNGAASVTASGNIAPVTYLWSNGATTQSISNLIAGTYTVTVTETPTCSTTASYTVTEPVLLNVVCAKSDVTTNGGTDGTASVSASGGTSPYTYLWSNGATTSSISNLTSGTYSVTVSDSNGCTSMCSSVVNAPGCNLSATTTGTNVTCNGGTNGAASVTASGNIAPVTYLWSNGATTQSISNLTAGTYTVTVTETPTCITTASYTVTEPILLNVVCTKSDVTTNGGTDGTASVSASGGTSPYTYVWSNGGTTSSISNLSSGTYNVTVSDSNGCTSTCSTIVNEPNAVYGSIGDYVWMDNNKDGIQDNTEPAVQGVILELYDANNLTTPIAKDTTDSNGHYLFSDLSAGDYIVKAVKTSFPTGKVITDSNNGTDDVDSDFDVSSGLSQIITLNPNNTGGNPLLKDNNSIDLGLYLPLVCPTTCSPVSVKKIR